MNELADPGRPKLYLFADFPPILSTDPVQGACIDCERVFTSDEEPLYIEHEGMICEGCNDKRAGAWRGNEWPCFRGG